MSQSPTVVDHVTELGNEIKKQIRRIVVVPDTVLEPILIALIAGGHVLIEGIPGIGKTLLARTIARSVDLSFHRIQFTNDLMPSDIVGSTIWNPGTREFDFVKGPLFANIVLADEINRTSPRTLSCLLEAMENGRVTVEGKRMCLGEPFLVLATRNPIEFHGTYPVPEAALDRFLLRVELEYPDEASEIGLYRGTDPESLLEKMKPIINRELLLDMCEQARKVKVSAAVASYCYRVVTATRKQEGVLLGASPRAALAWLEASRVRAFLDGRDFLIPDDLKALAQCVLVHRIFLAGGGSSAPMLEKIIAASKVEL